MAVLTSEVPAGSIMSDSSIDVTKQNLPTAGKTGDLDVRLSTAVEQQGNRPEASELDRAIKYAALTYESVQATGNVAKYSDDVLRRLNAGYEAAQIPDRKMARLAYCDYWIGYWQQTLVASQNKQIPHAESIAQYQRWVANWQAYRETLSNQVTK